MEKIKRWMSGPSLDEMIIDIQMYTKQIKRTQKKFNQRAVEMRQKAKQQVMAGETARAKMYMKQALKAQNTSFSLDMFTISMEDLTFDLKNTSNVNQMAPIMGKISKSLEKLDILKTGNVSRIMGKVNGQIERAGFSMEQIFDEISDYEPFSIGSFSDQDVDVEIEKLTEEVMAEGPMRGLPAGRIQELQKKRDEIETQE